ncbi:MAG: DUF3343 domain-containing protein [Desulfovibrio sp.]|nr:DUF3343 domain-containing protein [Desulfovibrio sp.]
MPDSWWQKLASGASRLLGSEPDKGGERAAVSDRGILVFHNTSEVIAAERALRQAGFDVEVKGPPPDLQTGCDMIVVVPVLKLAAIESCLKKANLAPEQVITEADTLLDPVSLFHAKDLGQWLMVRAANMKITIDKATRRIVNISGGGCPDVPWLAHELVGKKLCDAPAPITIGHTLCCYSLQKAFDEMKRIQPCG